MNVRKLVSRHTRQWQIILIVLGAFTGFLLTWLPLQLYFDVNSALQQQKDLLGDNYFIISKPVSILNTLGLPSIGFKPEDVDELNKQPFVARAAAFTINRFKANIDVRIPNTTLRLYTEIFFESVPNAFIDELPSDWGWNNPGDEVPVIVPTDYFNLYNFGFAKGQGLPQVSGSAAKLLSFTINITSSPNDVPFKGHIVGFSDRINSVLVPQSFMDYANKNFAMKDVGNPARLIVEVKDAAAFSKFIGEKGYETNNELLRSGKIKSLSATAMNVVVVFGLLIVLLSLGSFIQFTDLVVARAEYEIKTLNYMGYPHGEIAGIFFKYVARLVVMAVALTIIAGIVLRYFLLEWFGKFFDTPVSFSYMPVVILLALLAAYLSGNYLNLRLHCRRLSKPVD